MRMTKGELKLMRLLWERGEMKPPELAELCDPPMKDAALRAMLAVLVEKGHVARRRDGRAYYYKAVTPERRAYSSMLKDLIENFCNGSAKELMFNLVEQENLTEEEIRKLQALAKATKRGKK